LEGYRQVHFGICGLEKDGDEGYTHSAEALRNLPSRLIGSLLDIDSESYDQWPIRSATGGVVFAKGEFKLFQKIKFSESTSLFKWQQPGVKLVTNLKGIDWMGKHYMVSAPGKTKNIRLYTHCMSLADEVRAHDRGLVQKFKAMLSRDPSSYSSIAIPNLPSTLDYIPLAVKLYPLASSFSTIIHELPIGGKLNIKGPFGRGFCIPQHSPGTILLVAGGTGILPFVDLLNVLLKKAMCTVLQKRGLDNSFIQPCQEYSMLLKDLSFALFCSFKDIDDFVNLEQVRELHQISEQHGLDLFKCFVRLDKDHEPFGLPTTRGYFNSDFFRKSLPELGKLRHAYICGPQGMHKQVFIVLHKELSVAESCISFV